MKLYLDVTMEKWRKAPDYTPPVGHAPRTSTRSPRSWVTGASRPAPTADATPGQNTNVNATAVTSVANTAYYAYLAKITADSARVLGKADDAAKYDALYERIKRDFNARFWDEARGYYIDPQNTTFMSQSAQVLALAMDLVPADKRRGAAGEARQRRAGHPHRPSADRHRVGALDLPGAHRGRARGRAERGQGGVHGGAADDVPVATATGSRRSASPASARTGSRARARATTRCSARSRSGSTRTWPASRTSSRASRRSRSGR